MRWKIVVGTTLSLLLVAALLWGITATPITPAVQAYGEPDEYTESELGEPYPEEKYEPDEVEVEDVIFGAASVSITPQSHIFSTAQVGYGEQAAQIFTITNTGDALVWFDGWGYHYFDVTSLDGGEPYYEFIINPGETFRFSVRPRLGLGVGRYEWEFPLWLSPGPTTATREFADAAFSLLFTVTSGGEGLGEPYAEEGEPDVTVTATGAAGTASATITPQSHIFPSAQVGYGEQAAQTFTITNTGDVALWINWWSYNSYLVDITTPFLDDYIDGHTINPGQIFRFSSRPRLGLEVGRHEVDFLIELSDYTNPREYMQFAAMLSFTVTN